jgi:TRAP transporter TAXI family solute receptor
MRKAILLLAGLGLGLASAAAEAKSYTLTLCGASPGGLWSLLGAGVDGAMKDAYPGSTVTYQTSGGGFANVALLSQKKCELAIIHDAELKVAKEGGAPFTAPVEGLRTVAVLYNWAPMQFIVTKSFAEEHGISSLDDIAKKKAPIRIMLNRRGNIASQLGQAFLDAAGASLEDIESWGGQVIFAASKEQGALIKDRRADAIFNSLFVGHRSVRQVAEAVDMVILPISDQVIATVAEAWNIAPYTIKGGSYAFQPDDVATVTLSAQLVAEAGLDEATAYDVTKAIVEKIDKLQGVHKAMRPLTDQLLADGKVVPYHAGAAKYYKEAGLQ